MTTRSTNPRRRTSVRIGGASGFWSDTALAVPQLLAGGELDHLVFDDLAEVTMSILVTQRAKDANAGGVNPLACRDALLTLRVGVVLGDDLLARSAELRATGVTEMFSGEAFPQRVASVNAHLGALPIARALVAGCDVVITGRGVASAVTLSVLMHAFGWSDDAYDPLAQGMLSGHLIEWGAQCTGGLVTPATVAEQRLYDIGDPRASLVPDVSCDFTQVRMAQEGEHRVRVTGATGLAPDSSYEVSATFADGCRSTGFFTIVGEQAVQKAQRTGAALRARWC